VLPDPSEPEFPALAGAAGAFLAAAVAFLRRSSREEVEWEAFRGGFVGSGTGIVIYLVVLITGL